MQIDNLTYGELKQIAAMFGAAAYGSALGSKSIAHPMIGKYCIARCYAAGVHAGTVVSVDGENVLLSDSRRLWSWKAKEGVALSGVAQNGVQGGCKIDVVNPEIYLTGVCELIPCSVTAKDSINDFKK